MATGETRPARVSHEGHGHDLGDGGDPHVGTAAVRDARGISHTQAEPEYQEKPEDWGWHADLGGLARFGGVFTLIALALMLTATHYNHAGTLALVLCMIGVAGGLVWDRRRRKNSWRR